MKKINFVNGTTIDGATTFNKIQDNVENVFNGEESMGSIVVEDVVCKNLANINVIEGTKNNIDKTYNSETKELVFSGTATGNTYFAVIQDIYLEAKTTYTISVSKTLPSNVKIYANNFGNVGLSYSDLVIASNTKSKTFTTKTAGKINFAIEILSGATVDLSLLLQIEKGSVATNYVPHKEFENKDEVVLYDNPNGNNGDITLNDNVSNYKYIEIFYRDNDDIYSSVKVYEANNKIADVTTDAYFTGTYASHYIKTKRVQVVNSAIKSIAYAAISITKSNGEVVVRENNNIYITRVVGYPY